MYNYITGREIINLIDELQKKGMPSDEIIDKIKHIALTDLKEQTNK